MNDQALQGLVEKISSEDFGRKFKHRAFFNGRLRTTGGRYRLQDHDIEINPKMLTEHGSNVLIGINMNCVIIICIWKEKDTSIRIRNSRHY